MTDTETLTITDFLLARIAEDEKMANAALGCHAYAQDYPTRAVMYSASGDALFEFDERQMREADHSTLALAEHFCSWQPARVLAECKAKREIVDLYAAHLDRAMAYRSPRWADAMSETDKAKAKRQEARLGVSEVAIRYLAAVYASHPDYDPEWADMTYR